MIILIINLIIFIINLIIFIIKYHNIMFLIHKTTTHNWGLMQRQHDRQLKCMGREIHLVPVDFFNHDPDMLRQYGERVLLFNLNREETRNAIRTARETPNGYIQVCERIDLEHLEAVYALENNSWVFPYNPVTEPRFCEAQGITMAHNMLK